jgi:hypothetical protein
MHRSGGSIASGLRTDDGLGWVPHSFLAIALIQPLWLNLQAGQPEHKQRSKIEPREPISPHLIKRGIMAHRNGGQHCRQGTVGVCGLLREDSPAIVAGCEQSVFGITHQGEAAFHAAHQRQVPMPDGVYVHTLIPGRHQHEPHWLMRVAAGQLGKVDVAADFNADLVRRLRGHRDFSARRAAAFPRRNEMMFAVDGLDLAGCGIETSLVIGAMIGDVENIEKYLDIGGTCRALKERV